MVVRYLWHALDVSTMGAMAVSYSESTSCSPLDGDEIATWSRQDAPCL